MKWLSVLLALLPMQAHALSCMQPSIAHSYAQYDAAPKTYVIFSGEIILPKGAQMNAEETADINNREGYTVTAQMRGFLGARTGFKSPIDVPVTLHMHCLAAWCAGTPSGDVVAFVERTGSDHKIDTGPCGGAVFRASKEAERDAVKCLNGRCPAVR